MHGLDRDIRRVAHQVQAVQDGRARLIAALPEKLGPLPDRLERVPRAELVREEVEPRQHHLVEHPAHLIGGRPDADGDPGLGRVPFIAGGDFIQDQVSPQQPARRGPRVAEDHPRAVHRRRPDDQEIDLSPALEDRVRRRGFQGVLRHPRPRGVDHGLERRRAEIAGPADPLQFGGALDDEKLVEEIPHQDGLRSGEGFGQRAVLVEREVVAVPGIDHTDAQPPLVQPELPDSLDQDLGELPPPGGADVLHRHHPPRRLDVRAAHAVDHGGVALARDQEIQGEGVPLAVVRQPEQPASVAPVVRASADDQRIEPQARHLGARALIAAPVLLFRKPVVDRVLVIGRAAHGDERCALIERAPNGLELAVAHTRLLAGPVGQRGRSKTIIP